MKIGIVGHGSIGRRHAANARTLGHEVKVYDPASIRDFKFEHEIYDWCDAAVIATPSLCHEAGLRACVERGKHALVEKPIAILIGHWLPELLRLADEKKLTIMMGNNLRFHPGVKRAREWLAGKKPIWATFICAAIPMPQNAREGVILNTGAHEVDIALHLFGKVAYVAGASAHYVATHEDIADFTLVHVNGVRSTFHLDFITERRERGFFIATDVENLTVNLDRRTFYRPQQDDGTYLGGTYDNDYVVEMIKFAQRIEGDDVCGATGHDGLETLRVLLNVKTKAAFQ